MFVEGKPVERGDPHRRAVQDRLARRARAETRWNDPEMQHRDAVRREMEEGRRYHGKVESWTNSIKRLRLELDQLEKTRVTKETELRSLVAQLAELTGEAPITAETVAEADVTVEQPVEAVCGRGRPKKVPA